MNVLYNIFKPFKNCGIGYEFIQSYSRNLTVNTKSQLWAEIYITLNGEKLFNVTVGVSEQYKNEYYISNVRNSIIERLRYRKMFKTVCQLNKKEIKC